MRSNSRGGRAVRSTPARWSSPKKPEAAMAKTEGPQPPDALTKLAAPERVAAFRTGLSAESRAAAFLMAKGYRILAKRFRTPYGEIDLVAKKRNLIAFLDVTARDQLEEAANAVTLIQQACLIDY